MESEYVAVAHAMRELLPMKKLLKEVAKALKVDKLKLSTVSTVWEDNAGAQMLANKEMPLMTSRTKHFGIKYHWFRSHIDGINFAVEKIDGAVQKGDIFTKGLSFKKFVEKRAMIMGW